MKCPKCNSENVQVQAKEFKPRTIGASCLIGAGLGLIFLSILGAIIGIGVGVVIGIVLNSIMGDTYQSVMVCQNCGYVMQPNNLLIPELHPEHPLYCDSDESNFEVVRNDDLANYNIVVILIKIDDYYPFSIRNNSITKLKVPVGVHTIYYEQINGIGRKKNKGQLSVNVSDKESISFSLTRQGLIVK